MTKPASELIALADERAVLMAKNAAATSWGAAVGARSERIKEIDGLLAANQSGSERAGVDALVRGQYVVRKGGYFYRPNAQGYTSSIYEAGLWPESEARKYADSCEEVTVHAASEFTPPAQPAPARAESSTSSDGMLPLYETAGGFPVAAAPYHAEETGVIQSTRQGAGVERGMDQCVTGGESAATPSTHCKPDGAVRACTCHPSDNPPVPCAQKFAYSECVKAEAKSQEPEARPVAIKPLEWEPAASIGITSYRATAIGLRYYVYQNADDGFWHAYTEGYQHASFAPTRSLDAAKAAAQADYEQRIRSALMIHPTTKPEAPAVSVDAIKRIIRGVYGVCEAPYAGKFQDTSIGVAATAIAALIAGERTRQARGMGG